ncbi:MAG: hypothetical protein WBB01_19065 [Phormidesmis sp.]
MWTIFAIALTISLGAGYLFFTASDRRDRLLEGLVALGSMMICLGVAPWPVKVLLLAGIFIMEQYRVRWEKTHEQ